VRLDYLWFVVWEYERAVRDWAWDGGIGGIAGTCVEVVCLLVVGILRLEKDSILSNFSFSFSKT